MAEPMSPEELAAFAQAMAAANEATEKTKPPKTLEEEVGPEPFSWQEAVIAATQRELRARGKEIGYNQDLMDGIVDQHGLGMVQFIERIMFGGTAPGSRPDGSRGSDITPDQLDAMSFQRALDLGMTWLGGRTGLGPLINADFSDAGGGGGGRGGGVRKPTAAEIRASFDMDQLSRSVTELYRGKIFDEPRDPRGLAKSYVDAVVANPEQQLDFQTFVEMQIEKEPRHKAIYANKPAGLTDGQFMAPYLNSAMQVLRPGNAGEVARAGAQLGSSPGAFQERLNKSRESQVGAPFITGMENRITQLGSLFKTQ